MQNSPQALIHRWFDEVWNQGREETVDELFASDGVGHGLGEGTADVHGPAAFKVFLHNMRSALPDVQIRIEDTIADDVKAVVRVVLEGTHLGEGFGVTPTGRRVTVPGIVIARVAHGQIVEAWNSWDQLGLMRRIGAIPASRAPDLFLNAQV
jgi:steroid delta-isomerase-like uncharacterized protein